MENYERNAAAEVTGNEIAATRIFLETLGAAMTRVKNNIVANLALGTEADAKLRAESNHVLDDINYPDVGAVHHS